MLCKQSDIVCIKGRCWQKAYFVNMSYLNIHHVHVSHMFCHLDLRDDISGNYYVKHCGSERGACKISYGIVFFL